MNNIVFDYSDISIEEISEQYINFKYVYTPVLHYGSLLLENSNGEYTYDNTHITVPIETVKKDISYLFNLKPWQFKSIKQCNNIACAFIIPNIGDNKKLIVKSMNQLGWFNSISDKYNIEDKQYIILKFEPLYELDITKEIHKLQYLYHISPKSNNQSIQRNGFIPLNNNTLFDYPKRIYFIKDNIDTDIFVDIAYELYTHYEDKSKTEYIIYTLDINKIPKNIKFQNDPNMEHGCFTYYKVPYKAVIDTKLIDLREEMFLI